MEPPPERGSLCRAPNVSPWQELPQGLQSPDKALSPPGLSGDGCRDMKASPQPQFRAPLKAQTTLWARLGLSQRPCLGSPPPSTQPRSPPCPSWGWVPRGPHVTLLWAHLRLSDTRESPPRPCFGSEDLSVSHQSSH